MILTRYLGSHLEDILTNCRLKVSRVSELNDPFEFRYKVVGKMTRDADATFLQRRLEKKDFIQQLRNYDIFRGKSDLDIKHHFQENRTTIEDNLLDTMPDAVKQLIDGVAGIADEIVRVVCFSNPTQKQLEEILLWSHYTRNHSGFRIWINLSLEPLLSNTTREVVYSDDLISLDINDPDIEQNAEPVFKKAMATKAICWDYEDEIRVFIPKKYCKLEKVAGNVLEYIDISLESLTRIDFGIRFPIEERDKLIERMNEKGLSNIEFFQCGLSYDEYAIEYEEV